MLIFKEQFSNVIKTTSDSSKTERFPLLVGSVFFRFPFFCRCSYSGMSSWLRDGAGSHGSGGLLPGCAVDQRVSVSGNAAQHHAAAQDSKAEHKILPDHTDPGVGIKLISKRQEKQPAGQPELSLPGSLQIILAYTS